MKVNQSYTKKPPHHDDIRRYCEKLTKMCREFEKLFPTEMGISITLGERMIEIDDTTNEPLQFGCMFSDDKTMDKVYAQSFADELHNHIGDHLRRRR